MPSPLVSDPTQISPLAAQNNPQPQPSVQDIDRQNATANAFASGKYYKDAAGNMQIIPPSKFDEATKTMQLNPQEQALYQLHLQNLYGQGGVNNPDGTRSTLYQITAEIDGKTYVIPTVWSGQIVPPDKAIQLAKQKGLDTFPSYADDKAAEARYRQMHGYMEQDTAAYQKRRR
jgi:hypothetical protein